MKKRKQCPYCKDFKKNSQEGELDLNMRMYDDSQLITMLDPCTKCRSKNTIFIVEVIDNEMGKLFTGEWKKINRDHMRDSVRERFKNDLFALANKEAFQKIKNKIKETNNESKSKC